MPITYLDSSVLIAALYEQRDQLDKYAEARRLITAIRDGSIQAVISFYALPELYDHIRHNQPEAEVSTVFRLSIVELFRLPIQVQPFLDRTELNQLRQQFTISDADDVRHVAAALSIHCDAIITFDHHF